MMKAIVVSVLAGGATIALLYFLVLENRAEIARLANRQNYIFEVVRRRALSPEICEEFSDDQMSCVLNAQKVCACTFEPDDLDIQNQIYSEAVKAAAAQIVAEKKAEAEEEPTE